MGERIIEIVGPVGEDATPRPPEIVELCVLVRDGRRLRRDPRRAQHRARQPERQVFDPAAAGAAAQEVNAP
jgi:hypothetical protein